LTLFEENLCLEHDIDESTSLCGVDNELLGCIFWHDREPMRTSTM